MFAALAAVEQYNLDAVAMQEAYCNEREKVKIAQAWQQKLGEGWKILVRIV